MNRPQDEPPAIPELARMAREADVSELEEERTVRALRSRGLLGRDRRVRRPPFRLPLQIAAAIVLFAGGVLVGARLGPTPTTAAPVSTDDTANAALAVQRTGSSFVRAISSVAAVAPSADPRTVAEAHEAARNALHAAQAALDRTPMPNTARGGPHVIWF